MNTAILDVPKVEARKAAAEYLKAVRARHTREDELILRGYREIVRGHSVISLQETFAQAGLNEQGLPKLGIVRADAETCFIEVEDGRAIFTTGSNRRAPDRGGLVTAHRVRVRVPELKRSWQTHSAIVPIVPPQYRPAHPLGGYHILWEAEWRRVAPKDPALLKHIAGDLWAVLAIWDLTELERAVIMGRMRA